MTQETLHAPDNVWSGPAAVADFLHPKNVAPLVELSSKLNPFSADDVRIFAKIYSNPNIKLLPAIYMLEDARKSGKLEDTHTLVEASSGNMVHTLDLVKGHYGISTLVSVVPIDIAPGKSEILRLRRIQIRHHTGDGIHMARELGREKGWLNLDQYSNPANPRAHEEWTGPQILAQTGPSISLFCAGLGTTATMEGTVRFLRNNLGEDGITSVGVMCEEGSAIPGVRRESQLKPIGFNWKCWSDHIEKVTTRDAYVVSRQLFLEGIPAGPSSGLALRGLLNFLVKVKKAGLLDQYRKSDGANNGKVVAVFICPDPPDKYLEKYSVFLDPEDFRADRDTIVA